MRYLDPKNDLTFKKLFGQHPDLLISLLNALMPLDEDQIIESVEYLPAELVPEIPEFKNSIVDVRCHDNHDRQFIVEMQMLWTPSFKHRILFNAAKAYVRQLDRGHRYDSLQPVYALNLVNDTFIDNDDEFYHHYSIVNVENSERRLDGLEFVFIELPKFRPQSIVEKKMTVLWLRFLTEIKDGREEVDQEFLDQNEIRRALELLNESAFTAEELEVYDKYWDAVSTEKTYAAEQARLAMEKGMTRGIEKGIKQGIEQGIEKAKKEMVIRLYNQGVEGSIIMTAAQVTEVELERILSES